MAGVFEIAKSKNGQYLFNLKAGNGQVILTSELYTSKGNAEAGIDSVKKNAPEDSRYEKKQASNGQHYFVLTAANHQTIGKSEMYTSTSAMENGIQSVKKHAPDAATKDLTA